ncbi:MAG TPA: hypothetical protein VFO52_13455 [Longimicrobiales bacterium]|nr:hypothetical protein [Longimicrobiales bacterium]
MRNQWMLTAFLATALATAAQASPPDDAWLAWAGCWRADGDSSTRSLCIVPDADGARMITVSAGRIESETRMVADGRPHAITQEGCTGTETARWSVDRKRVFIDAQLNCGNNITRKVNGMFVMLGRDQWTSVQSITTSENKQLHTVRYLETEPVDLPAEIAQAFRNNRLARETVRLAAASPLDLADVIDAVAYVQTEVIEAWLTTVGQEFELNAQTLIALAEAGVPSSVIDVLVAVSNPGHFAVREERLSDRDMWGGRRPVSCLDSYWIDPYDPFGYRGSYYSNYGCRRGSGFYPSWGGSYWGGGSVIVIDRGTLRPRGRVTKQGYKRPRDDTFSTSSTGTTGRASTPPKSSGDSGSGSSSSSGDSGGRKAKPRDN